MVQNQCRSLESCQGLIAAGILAGRSIIPAIKLQDQMHRCEDPLWELSPLSVASDIAPSPDAPFARVD